MDLITQLGEVALGSRLKRVSDRLMQDGSSIYKELNIGFEPRWFPLFYLIHQCGEVSITDAARELGVTHPAVNQIAEELIRQGLISPLKDQQDKRKRLLTLTKKGKQLVPQLQTAWEDIRAALTEIVHQTNYDVLHVIEALEHILDEKSFYQRFLYRHKARLQESVEIIDYEPQYRGAFRTLNMEWIQHYFQVEPIDESVLSQPESYILEPGGFILFARDKATQEILGTCALMKHKDNTYELTKMAVTEKARGRQIGQKLAEAVIAKAQSLNLESIMLETNSSLAPAIQLYRKLGFISIPLDTPSEYARADVRMVLDLTKNWSLLSV